MRTLGLLVVVLVSGVLGVGCSAIVNPDSRLLDDDGGVIGATDMGSQPGEDAWSAMPDAWQMPGCAEVCTDGMICDGTNCVCPADACCPLCGADQNCTQGTCEACGGEGQACCAGGGCGSGTTCFGGVCAACGGVGDACCADGSCAAGSECNGATCEPCGEASQRCCAGGMCAGTATCGSDQLCHGDTSMCGDQGEPCCLTGSCNSNDLVCNGGFPLGGGSCDHCGDQGESCCSSNQCSSGLGCFNGSCAPCGAAGQRCCALNRCRDGATCRTGTCR